MKRLSMILAAAVLILAAGPGRAQCVNGVCKLPRPADPLPQAMPAPAVLPQWVPVAHPAPAFAPIAAARPVAGAAPVAAVAVVGDRKPRPVLKAIALAVARALWQRYIPIPPPFQPGPVARRVR